MIAIVGILIGMILPAVQTVREAARRTQCSNRLRQVGLATIMFHDANAAFPPARLYPAKFPSPPLDRGEDQPTWFVRILPFLEQQAFYSKWDLSAPYGSQLQEVVETPIESFLCPTRRSIDEALAPTQSEDVLVVSPCGCGGWVSVEVTGGATGDFAGNHGDLSPGSVGAETDYYYGGNGTGVIISSQAKSDSTGRLTWVDRIDYPSISDGSSNTILCGELHVSPENMNKVPYNGPIYNGEDLAAFTRVGGPGVPILSGSQQAISSVLGFGSWHPGTCNFVLADGSTKTIQNTVDTLTLGQLCHRADGDVLAIE